MELKSLHMSRWNNAADLTGSIEFFSSNGEIKIQLRPEHIKKIISVVADALVSSAQSVANDLTANILIATAQNKQLVDQSTELQTRDE